MAKCLGYSNPSKALNDHCKGITKCYILTNGEKQQLSFIPEGDIYRLKGDIYRLITHSKLESAQKFESWVFDEVLPSIRKNGGYIANQENLDDDELIAKALIVANNIINQKNKIIAQQKEQLIEQALKVEVFERIANGSGCYTVNYHRT